MVCALHFACKPHQIGQLHLTLKAVCFIISFPVWPKRQEEIFFWSWSCRTFSNSLNPEQSYKVTKYHHSSHVCKRSYCSTRISRSPRISRTRYPRGILHADISHSADISPFFCYEISAGDLARGYLVTPNHVALNFNITQIKSIVLDINS